MSIQIKMYSFKCLAVSVVLIFTAVCGCERLNPERAIVVACNSISNVSYTSAEAEGTLIDDGKDGIVQYGFCWSTTEHPEREDFYVKLEGLDGPGTFSAEISGLSVNTKYYIRAYAFGGGENVYGNELSFTTTSDGQIDDIEGNTYNFIKIGTQTWMTENLKTTKYNDGRDIPIVTSFNQWVELTTDAFCWYDNSEENFKDYFGALYNWYAVESALLCPKGWHVPSDDEWTTLLTYLGGEEVAGGKLKESGTFTWKSPNTGASNSSGFGARPAGIRFIYDDFKGINYYTLFRSSTFNGGLVLLANEGGNASRGSVYNQDGLSVRCLKDQ